MTNSILIQKTGFVILKWVLSLYNLKFVLTLYIESSIIVTLPPNLCKMYQKLWSQIQQSPFKYVLFWMLVFTISVVNSSWIYSGNTEVFVTYGIRIAIQMAFAHIFISLVIPKTLNRKQYGMFWASTFVLLILFYIICTAVHQFYLEPTYPDTYAKYLKRFSDTTFTTRLLNIREFISKSLYVLFPAFLLLVLKLYNEKQNLLKLNEQKKTAELTALKNQLNPHFLFNTLNNLYALALKKSDDTTLVIQKLSSILDYILYRCNDDYVTLENEIELIENYLSLEKIRYGDRVNINFSKNVTGKEKIAPLLLLTFIENAFKHGVAEELEQATVNISITKIKGQLEFLVQNSKPQSITETTEKESIGLNNIKKQLELLYPKAYNLIIDNKTDWYSANLKLDMV